MPLTTTLMKLTSRCGRAVVDTGTEALLAKAAWATLLRVAWLGADTSVVPAEAARSPGQSFIRRARSSQ